MGQKYLSSKQPFKSDIESDSLWECCVAKNGRRKKAYSSVTDANVAAKKKKGRPYPCRFNSNTYHVTTKSKSAKRRERVTAAITKQEKEIAALLKRNDELNIKIVLAEAEKVELLKTLEKMTSATSLEEIKALEQRWNELTHAIEARQESIRCNQNLITYYKNKGQDRNKKC